MKLYNEMRLESLKFTRWFRKLCLLFKIIKHGLQALDTLFHIEGYKFFKKGQLQGRLKQLSFEQDPGHNTR